MNVDDMLACRANGSMSLQEAAVIMAGDPELRDAVIDFVPSGKWTEQPYLTIHALLKRGAERLARGDHPAP